ncbi:MAG: hypothetical protein WCZ86_06090 [Desulfurivibrionaceae bacterium]
MKKKLYPYITPANYEKLTPVYRIPHVAAYYSDVESVRELGVNAGLRVQEFLANVGLGKGFAWCGAFVYSVCLEAGVPSSCLPVARKAASVAEWVKWARKQGILKMDGGLYPTPKRGSLCGWLNRNGTGHIFLVTSVTEEYGPHRVYLHTIEGNTNKKGSRDGDGVYRNRRGWPNEGDRELFWIDMTKLKLS